MLKAGIFDCLAWPDGTIARATFDHTLRYRFRLERDFRPNLAERELAGTVTFVMLNPSTADALQDDPTLRRCSGFARSWGYKRLLVVNLFAMRSTSPAALKTDPEPVGLPEADAYILAAASASDRIIAAWGTRGVLGNRRDLDVLAMLRAAGHGDRIFALRITKHGHPEHPLYVPASAELVPFGRA